VINFIKQINFNKDAAVILLTEELLKQGCVPKGIKTQLSILGKSQQFSAELGQIFPVVIDKTLLLIVGLGKEKDLTLTQLRITLRNALLSSYLKKLQNIEILSHDNSKENISSVIEAVILGTYEWTKYLTKDKKEAKSSGKKYFIAADKNKHFDDIINICEGVNIARDLINDNADTINSQYLEKSIRSIIKNNKKFSLEVLNEKELKKKGLNLLLAVNQGSNKDAKLIIAKYKGNPKSKDYTAIIGKGITFDTGGLNLKPTGRMETMRQDMSGAASVIALINNAIKLDIKQNIIFACAIAENAIGPSAYKPGDIIKSYSGKTVEIGNTDAEGRLVLADAISYIVKNYKPQEVIDIATLTGACAVALGLDYSALVSNNDALAKRLITASKETDDRAWRLPSYPELKDSIKSKIADIKNTSNLKGAGGTITGAEFLRQFTDNTPWAHLDIANTAWVDNGSRMYFGAGATGSCIRLLTYYLKHK